MTRQVLALQDDPGKPSVGDVNGVGLAALAPEYEAQPRPLDAHVLRAKRGESERAIQARVLRIAYSDERPLQKPDHGGEHTLTRQARPREIALYPAANARERATEFDEAVVLRLVSDGSPPRVIAVLLPASSVAPDRLDVAGRRRTDPHVRPGRRNGQ